MRYDFLEVFFFNNGFTCWQDILDFIEDAPHGVIYFTFGSIVSMSSLPENVQSAFRNALARVPQKVLWKFEGEMADKPKNVMTRKWFPQRDLLGVWKFIWIKI